MSKIDANKAHKRIRVKKKDWRYIAAKYGHGDKQRFVINKTGTYGIASAQFWWGRMAAIINRLCITMLLASWVMTYVDDLIALHKITADDNLWDQAAALLAFLLYIGLPISWKNTRWVEQWNGSAIT